MGEKITRTIIDSALAFLKKQIDSASKKVSEAIKGGDKQLTNAVKSGMSDQSRLLAQAVARVEKVVDKIKDPVFSGEVTMDTSAMNKELKAVSADLKKLNVPEVKNIEMSLKLIYDCLEENKKITDTKMNEMVEAVKGISLSVPDSFKLDKEQLRSIRSGGGMATTGGELTARSATTANVTMTTANTEYSYTFPANTSSFHMKLRAQNVKFKHCWTSGESGTTYMTTPQNSLQSRPGIDLSGVTIYFQSDTASQEMEIDSYQA